ncbi:MAG TPA: NAD(P)H-dependent oxidoreductase [Rhizomicrobium sp.]|nr:NAD(P)H-dependent oxidoreductase [Rhizomicrobium sp.]
MLRPDAATASRGPSTHGFLPFRFSRKRQRAARIALINGHPDPRPERFCAALCRSYAEGAVASGHELRIFAMENADAEKSRVGEAEPAFAALDWANRIAVVFPLWLDRPPEPLTRLFQDWRAHAATSGRFEACERRARLIVTMAVPAFAHRARWRGAGSALSLPGIDHARLTCIGSVEAISSGQRHAWLADIREMGREGV